MAASEPARRGGRSLPLRDNPGNAYLQALAETGAIGFLLTLALAAVLAREAVAALARWRDGAARGAGCGAGVLGFLVALAWARTGSRPTSALALLLFAAVRRARTRGARNSAAWPRRGPPGRPSPSTRPPRSSPRSRRFRRSEAFRYRRGIGFHGKEEGPGGPFYWTRRRVRDPRACRARRCAWRLAHYTPEGRSVELSAEADGRTVLSRDARARARACRCSLAAAAGRRANHPLHAFARVRAPRPRALRGPPRARPRRRFPAAVGAMEFQFHPASRRRRGAELASSARAGRRSPSSLTGAAAFAAVSLWVTVPAVAAHAVASASADARAVETAAAAEEFAQCRGAHASAWPSGPATREACSPGSPSCTASRRPTGRRASTPRRAGSPAADPERISAGLPRYLAELERARALLAAREAADPAIAARTPSLLPVAGGLVEPAVLFGPRVSPWTGSGRVLHGTRARGARRLRGRRAGRRHRRFRRARSRPR